MNLITIGIFGIAGVLSRYLLNQGMLKIVPSSFPFGILLVNILGCLGLGMVYGLSENRPWISETIKQGISAGFLGGFTTFSTYALDAVLLLKNAQYLEGLLYLIGSPLIGVLSVLGGMVLGRLMA